MATENSSKIPHLLNQVLDCIKESKGDALVASLKEVNQFFSSVNEHAFKQMGAQMSKSSNEGNPAASETKNDPAPSEPKSQPQQEPSNDAALKQPVAKQAEQRATTAQESQPSKETANGVSKHETTSGDPGLPKIRDGHVAVCSTTLIIKQIPKFWSDKKVKEKAEEYGSVISISYKPYVNTAVVSFKTRSDAFKALTGIPNTRPLVANWELNSGIASSYFKKYWDANEGATFIPASMFPWIKQKELLFGGAFLLDSRHGSAGSDGAANAAASSPSQKAASTAASPANQSSQATNKAAAPNSSSKPSTPNSAGRATANTSSRHIAGSSGGKGAAGQNMQKARHSTTSPAFSTAQNSQHKGAASAKQGSQSARQQQGDIPSLFANDFTRSEQAQSASSSGPRFSAPNNPQYQSMPPPGPGQPRMSPSMLQKQQIRPFGPSPSIGIAPVAAQQQLTNPFASPASRAPAPSIANIQQHPSFSNQGRGVDALHLQHHQQQPPPPQQQRFQQMQQQQQQQLGSKYGKRNSVESANSAGEMKRPRMEERGGGAMESLQQSYGGPMLPAGRGYVPGRNSFESSGPGADRPDMNRGTDFSPQTARSNPPFGPPYTNPAAGIRSFGTPRPVSNQGLLQPPAAGSRPGQAAPRPFRF